MTAQVDNDANQEDPLDLFDTSLEVLFSIPPIAFSTSASGTFIYTPPAPSPLNQPINLILPSPPAELYSTLQANNVWLSGVFLADQISLRRIDIAGQRIAELGAGAGLPGIVACLSGAQVVSSDWDTPGVIGAIEQNFKGACGDEGKWAVVGHTWGSEATPLLKALGRDGEERQFDVLLLADTLWMTGAHSVLLDSVFALLKTDGVAHVAAGLHTGRGPVERFRAAAEARGGIVSQLEAVRWQTGGGWEVYHSPKEGLEEERGVVVYFTLRRSNPGE